MPSADDNRAARRFWPRSFETESVGAQDRAVLRSPRRPDRVLGQIVHPAKKHFCIFSFNLPSIDGGQMRLIVSVIGVFGLLALVLVGAMWAVVMITPVGVFIGVAVFLSIRRNRRRAAIADALAREADRERELNRREYAAWKESVDETRRRDAKRLRALRKFDSTRDTPRLR
jgi:hypothetical protein